MGVGIGVRVVSGPLVDVGGEMGMERAADTSVRRERHEDWRHRQTGTLALVEQWEEIGGVLGDEDAGLVDCPGEYVEVGRAAEPDVSDVDSNVALGAEKLADALAVHLVEKKPHPAKTAARAAASFRTRSAASSFSWSRVSISSRCSTA